MHAWCNIKHVRWALWCGEFNMDMGLALNSFLCVCLVLTLKTHHQHCIALRVHTYRYIKSSI